MKNDYKQVIGLYQAENGAIVLGFETDDGEEREIELNAKQSGILHMKQMNNFDLDTYTERYKNELMSELL